jgi:uncharacterized protein involved in exopolysaccharide biosynthesis
MSDEIKRPENKDEIDLIELALKIWAERKIIYKTVAVFFVLGLIVAFGSKKEYKAECTFILDDNNGGSAASGLLSQFGGLAGINLNSAQAEGTISPDLYPNIVKSTTFMLELLDAEIYIEKFDTTTTVFNYLNELEQPSFLGYIKKYTIGLPGTMLGLIRNKDNTESIITPNSNNKKELLKLTKEQDETLKALKDLINISLDDKTGIINLRTELPDAFAAAELTEKVYLNLTEYLINYKIEKATVDLNFVQTRFEESKRGYEESQKALAKFRDQNINMSSAYFKTEEERLQSEFDVAFSVYKGLAQQVEQAKIKVQEQMPVFKILNKVNVPIERTKPKRSLTLVLMVFLGSIIGLLSILLKQTMVSLKKQYYS